LNESVLNESVLNESVLNESVLNESVLNESVLNESVLNESVINRSALNESIINRSSLNESIINRSSLNESIINRSSLNESALNESVINRSSLNESVINRSSLNESALNESVINGIITSTFATDDKSKNKRINDTNIPLYKEKNFPGKTNPETITSTTSNPDRPYTSSAIQDECEQTNPELPPKIIDKTLTKNHILFPTENTALPKTEKQKTLSQDSLIHTQNLYKEKNSPFPGNVQERPSLQAVIPPQEKQGIDLTTAKFPKNNEINPKSALLLDEQDNKKITITVNSNLHQQAEKTQKNAKKIPFSKRDLIQNDIDPSCNEITQSVFPAKKNMPSLQERTFSQTPVTAHDKKIRTITKPDVTTAVSVPIRPTILPGIIIPIEPGNMHMFMPDPEPIADYISIGSGKDSFPMSAPDQNDIKIETLMVTKQQQTGKSRFPVSAMTVQILSHTRSGANQFKFRMDPPELGLIQVNLDFNQEGRIISHLIVERPETLEMLMRDFKTLEKALNDSGLKTDESSLRFSLKDESFAQKQEEGRQKQWHNTEKTKALSQQASSIHENSPEPSVLLARSGINIIV
ncbi:MAG: flagellar hook-length control protein FliK, partial [Alphaproteobacteria bacterium]|nr:flagellar hook-length control protein FliK [Alphaproteobacteria bacterium]